MGRLFGTDGVRGIANKELNGELAYAIGVAAGYVLGKHVKGRKPGFLIGKDTRISGDMLEQAISAGLLRINCNKALLYDRLSCLLSSFNWVAVMLVGTVAKDCLTESSRTKSS